MNDEAFVFHAAKIQNLPKFPTFARGMILERPQNHG
jgi:hypothetical protein